MKLQAMSLIAALSLIACGTDSSASVTHVHGAHDGLVTTFAGGDTSGFLELKIHDDKGDIELWLAKDEGFEKPFLVPHETKIELEFVEMDGRKIELAIRNSEKNEGEDGTAHMVADETNYFIFPSRSDQDSSWLVGKAFKSKVIVRFAVGGVSYQSKPMVLQPHSH